MKISVRGRREMHPYTIHINRGGINQVGRVLKKRWPKSKVIILTDDTVYGLWHKHLAKSLAGAGIKEHTITIRNGERFKDLKTYNEIVRQMVDLQADRHSVLIAFGGGVIGDLGGLVAATYMRGIDLVQIPTTLVAQIDSSIGGKTAIDHQKAKNLIGCFYNPHLVLTDPEVLATLPDHDYLNGLFEAVKIALVGNKQLYAFIAKNLTGIQKRRQALVIELVGRCVREKVKVVQRDPFDRHHRMMLNFGHTFGHALETAKAYRGISHGEAVGWGMLLALRISHILGYCDSSKVKDVNNLIRTLLGRKKRPGVIASEIWKTMTLDKKSQDGAVRFILLKSIGRPIIKSVNQQTFAEALDGI